MSLAFDTMCRMTILCPKDVAPRVVTVHFNKGHMRPFRYGPHAQLAMPAPNCVSPLSLALTPLLAQSAALACAAARGSHGD